MTAFATPWELIPIGPIIDTEPSTVSSVTILDGAADIFAVIFQAKRASAIIGAGFRSDGGNGTPPTFSFNLRNVDTTTSPAIPGSTVHDTVTFTPGTAAANVTVSFSGGYVPALGELLAIDVRHSSGTIDGSNRLLPRLGARARGANAIPFSTAYNGTSWTAYTAGTPCFGIETAEGWYGEPVWGLSTATAISTNGHRATCKFQIPSQYATLDVIGFRMFSMPAIGTAQSADAVLLDAGGELLSKTFDSDVLRNLQQGREVLFDSAQTLAAATDYRIGFERNGTNISLFNLDIAAAQRSAHPNGSNNCYSSWNGSAWTDDTTKIVPMALLCSGYTLASSGGSSLILPQTFSPMMSL